MTVEDVSLLSSVTPRGVLYAELEDTGQALPLHPGEEAYVAKAADSRRRDFAAGRFCARAALSRLDRPGMVIAREADGVGVRALVRRIVGRNGEISWVRAEGA